MTSISKKIVVDEHGKPLEVIIAWDDFQDLAERMGWDVTEPEVADLQAAKRDWENGDRDSFVPLSALK